MTTKAEVVVTMLRKRTPASAPARDLFYARKREHPSSRRYRLLTALPVGSVIKKDQRPTFEKTGADVWEQHDAPLMNPLDNKALAYCGEFAVTRRHPDE